MADSSIKQFSTLATDPLRGFRFQVELTAASDGVFTNKILTTNGSPSTTTMSNGFVGGFTSVSGLNITTQAIQYREGGYNTTVHQMEASCSDSQCNEGP